jgi:hypothetical protein
MLGSFEPSGSTGDSGDRLMLNMCPQLRLLSGDGIVAVTENRDDRDQDRSPPDLSVQAGRARPSIMGDCPMIDLMRERLLAMRHEVVFEFLSKTHRRASPPSTTCSPRSTRSRTTRSPQPVR